MLPPIRGFIENTLLDWEGKIAAVVFLPGCNFRCPYCHARHLVEPLPSDEEIPIEAILLNLKRQQGWIDGVVISGGEPTLHPGLIALVKLFRAQGVEVKLDTNGSNPETLKQLLERGLLDYVAMDVKAPLDYRYCETAGADVDLDALRSSIALLLGGHVPYEFRTTVCPTFTAEEDVRQIGEAVRGARLLYLQSFRPVNCLDRDLESVKPYNPDRMRELCRVASVYVRRCLVRGDQASELVTAHNEQGARTAEA